MVRQPWYNLVRPGTTSNRRLYQRFTLACLRFLSFGTDGTTFRYLLRTREAEWAFLASSADVKGVGERSYYPYRSPVSHWAAGVSAGTNSIPRLYQAVPTEGRCEPGRSETDGVTPVGGWNRCCAVSGLCGWWARSERRTLGRLSGWAVRLCGASRQCRVDASERDLGGGR
jgi:hypothetical protein